MKKIAMIVLVATMSFAGVVGGGKYGNPRVEAHSRDYFDVVCYANENTTVTISGDGDTDLDLYVEDENGNTVGSSTTYGDDETVTINPRWTGRFRIYVKNLGDIFNRYSIVIQ